VDDVKHRTEQQPDCVQWEIDLLGDVDPVVRLRSAVELGRRKQPRPRRHW
jgi:hypothetical protein